MFGRKNQNLAAQLQAIAADEILRLMVSKGLVSRGEAAGCLRGIANRVVASAQACGSGTEGRILADGLINLANDMSHDPSKLPPVKPFYSSGRGRGRAPLAAE